MPGAVPSGNVSRSSGQRRRDLPAGELRAFGAKGSVGGGGIQRRARLNVLYALAELPLGAIAGDPLGLNE